MCAVCPFLAPRLVVVVVVVFVPRSVVVQKKKEKWVPPKATRIGKKRKKGSGPQAAYKLPTALPVSKCKLRLLRGAHQGFSSEEEFLTNQQSLKPREEKEEEEKSKVDEIRGSPMSVGTIEELIDDTHAIISGSGGPEYYVNIMSFVDTDQIEPGSTVLMHNKQMSIVGLLGDDVDPMVNVMKVDKAPTESYADIGGLQKQIQEVKEAVELPMTHPELYEDIGIKPPKGSVTRAAATATTAAAAESRVQSRLEHSAVSFLIRRSLCPLLSLLSVIFFGPPDTGKTLLAKAVANETSATFLRVVGSELILQKYLGDSPSSCESCSGSRSNMRHRLCSLSVRRGTRHAEKGEGAAFVAWGAVCSHRTLPLALSALLIV
jgi:26S proteasome regulatory subunit T2